MQTEKKITFEQPRDRNNHHLKKNSQNARNGRTFGKDEKFHKV